MVGGCAARCQHGGSSAAAAGSVAAATLTHVAAWQHCRSRACMCRRGVCEQLQPSANMATLTGTSDSDSGRLSGAAKHVAHPRHSRQGWLVGAVAVA
eukprot:15463675-Alexandrium_andersonii.AAC.1